MSAPSKNNISPSNATEGSGESSTQKKVINIIPYEKGVNYFKKFIESEESLRKHEYQLYPVDKVWMENKRDKPDDHNLYYLLYCRNLIAMRTNRNKTIKDDLLMMDKLNSNRPVEDFYWAFITLNFDDSNNPSIKQILTAVSKTLEKPFFINVIAVVERHRQDGIHLHSHFLVKFPKKISPTRVIDGIYALRSVQAVLREKNFIDYLGPQKPDKYHAPYQVYYDYIHGIKKDEKMPFVEQDRKWREENNIQHLYEKN